MPTGGLQATSGPSPSCNCPPALPPISAAEKYPQPNTLGCLQKHPLPARDILPIVNQYLGGHDFSVGATDLHASIETGLVVGFNNVTPIDFVCADPTVIGTWNRLYRYKLREFTAGWLTLSILHINCSTSYKYGRMPAVPKSS